MPKLKEEFVLCNLSALPPPPTSSPPPVSETMVQKDIITASQRQHTSIQSYARASAAVSLMSSRRAKHGRSKPKSKEDDERQCRFRYSFWGRYLSSGVLACCAT